jgi:hypothetical protein
MDSLCMACANVQVSPNVNLKGMIWGRVDLEHVSKVGNPPLKQCKISVLMFEIMYAMFQPVMMLMGTFGQAVFRLCKRALHTDSACCRTTVVCKLNEVLATG